jgi:parallel beta-helix repeat protein
MAECLNNNTNILLMGGQSLYPKYLSIILGLMLLLMSSVSAINTTHPFTLSKSNTLYVGGSGIGNYTKIQDAIDNASNGDTVYVYDDSSPYYEKPRIFTSINLIGEKSTTTKIDGGGIGDVITVYANNCSISEFTIQNGSFELLSAGIYLLSRNNNIHSNIINNVGCGVKNIHASNNVIYDNIIIGNGGYGVDIRQANTITVYNNIIIDNYDGGIGIILSNNNTILNNTIVNTTWGGISMWESHNNLIHHNKISHADWHGIFLTESHFNQFKNNSISQSIEPGISLFYSNNNLITANTVSENTHGCIVDSFCHNNTFYHNNFIDNTVNAQDDGMNTWDNGYPSCGNYWDDYSGIDNFSGENQNIPGSDGIGDTPFDLLYEYAIDRYPLMEPYAKTTLTFSSLSAGLFKSKITIKNIGDNTAFNVQWNISLDGGIIFLGRYSSGTLPKPLLSGEEMSITSGFVLGFGKILINISVWADNAPVISITNPGFLLLFFVIPYIVFPLSLFNWYPEQQPYDIGGFT